MSDDYAELKAQIFAAREIIGHLCAEGRPPRMSIPANRYADEDMVMDAALAAADKAIDALRAENERLRNLEKQVRALYNDADEWDCNGLGLHAPFAAWHPVFDALEAIDAAVKEGER